LDIQIPQFGGKSDPLKINLASQSNLFVFCPFYSQDDLKNNQRYPKYFFMEMHKQGKQMGSYCMGHFVSPQMKWRPWNEKSINFSRGFKRKDLLEVAKKL